MKEKKALLRGGMLTRILAMVLAVILVITAAMSVICWLTMRNRQINEKLQDLTLEARDIAMLAEESFSGSGLISGLSLDSSATRELLNRKANDVFNEYGAYILIVDRRGLTMDNLQTAWEKDPAFVESLSSAEISRALNRVLGGEEISVRTMISGEAMFTVGVPFTRRRRVMGAVFIQTRATRVEAGVSELIPQLILVDLSVFLVAAAVLFLWVRGTMSPLKSLTRAAGVMAEGNFRVRVEETGRDPDIRELAGAFNTMAERLEKTEQGRREFVANVSHELRSPITSIAGFVEGMRDGVIPEKDHPRYLKLVSDETSRLSTLIGDLLALSRLEREDAMLELSDFDMNELLRMGIIRRVKDLDEKNLEVACVFEQDPCPVRADRDRIEQVIINLLDNAIKFTPEQGRIELETCTSADSVVVTVRDNGPGIAPEDRPRVFERFFTVDRAHTSGKGTGLGLSICQRILEMHGRKIELLDTEEGAAFRFSLEPGKLPERNELPDSTGMKGDGATDA